VVAELAEVRRSLRAQDDGLTELAAQRQQLQRSPTLDAEACEFVANEHTRLWEAQQPQHAPQRPGAQHTRLFGVRTGRHLQQHDLAGGHRVLEPQRVDASAERSARCTAGQDRQRRAQRQHAIHFGLR
jgi:hypothetical protein